MGLFYAVLACAILQTPVFSLFHKDVTSSNFDKLLNPSDSHLLLEFYAPWCGHCKNLAPEYARLGESFSSMPNVVIAQIDADKHKKLAKRFDVKGFPTLKWVPMGKSFEDAEDVNAERTAEGLLKYVNEKTGLSVKLKDEPPSSVTTVTSDNFDQVTSGAYSLIGFFAPWCGHCKALKPTWEKLAYLFSEEKDVVIGAVNCDDNKDLCAKYDVTGYPTLRFFTGSDSEKYEQGRSVEDFVSYINEKTGLDLSPDGGVFEGAGVITELKEYVGSYMKAASDVDRTEIMNTCVDKMKELGAYANTNFKYYKNVFAKIAEQGVGYVKKEKDRLKRMIETTDTLKPYQKRNFMRRLNVLNAFESSDVGSFDKAEL